MAADESQPLQPQQAPPAQSQSGQVPPQNAIMAVGTNLKNAAVNVLKEVRVDLNPRLVYLDPVQHTYCFAEETVDGDGGPELLCKTSQPGRGKGMSDLLYKGFA